jgi:hypothetical protein
MDFYVYTARARFVSISADLQSNHEGAMTYGSSKPNALFPAACLGSGLDLRWIPNETFNKYIALSPINHFDDAVCGGAVLRLCRLVLRADFKLILILSGRGEDGVRGVQGAEAWRHRVVWNGEQRDRHVRCEAREAGGVVEGSSQAVRVFSLLHDARMVGMAHGCAADAAIPRLFVQRLNFSARLSRELAVFALPRYLDASPPHYTNLLAHTAVCIAMIARQIRLSRQIRACAGRVLMSEV